MGLSFLTPKKGQIPTLAVGICNLSQIATHFLAKYTLSYFHCLLLLNVVKFTTSLVKFNADEHKHCHKTLTLFNDYNSCIIKYNEEI